MASSPHWSSLAMWRWPSCRRLAYPMTWSLSDSSFRKRVRASGGSCGNPSLRALAIISVNSLTLGSLILVALLIRVLVQILFIYRGVFGIQRFKVASSPSLMSIISRISSEVGFYFCPAPPIGYCMACGVAKFFSFSSGFGSFSRLCALISVPPLTFCPSLEPTHYGQPDAAVFRVCQ